MWAKANPEKHNAQGRAWRQANPEKRAEIAARHRKSNQHGYTAREAARRAAARRAIPLWADLGAIEAVYKECARTSAETGVEHEVDHIYPLQSRWVCGLHVHTNMQILPGQTNKSKGNRVVPELMPVEGVPVIQRQPDLFWSIAA